MCKGAPKAPILNRAGPLGSGLISRYGLKGRTHASVVDTMAKKQELEQALEDLRLNAATLRLDAELDPRSLRGVADDLADRTGLDRDVALRVVEDELGVRPLPSRTPLTKGATIMDIAAQLKR